ncbi:MAG: translation initiation factor IF-2 [Candidatus Magasanikbacteria bacterium CG10_big_fil_rev_8_21_14_0_10_47_10]|uniref:Translation initiation factor IF-2 n=1 Tax=Candidatus Magasanikbacteria bacterium CG10_big_fil_rev_8_21_14_0_10_47_10 TaxID=1974652 RepID=A0A2H0TRG0_9BACT|nr:MAG: translation initiation factor IF-2 [Candidatus Magasanikbacteria bacterium CG10_big_fil_rev_8_21_14_0_10_47_10]
MNVTELARRLRVHPKELLRILPEYGFDIGGKAIKIDNKVAQQIMKMWPKIKRDMDNKRKKEQEEKRKAEKELRKESGETVLLPPFIAVRVLAERLKLPVSQIITELMRNGILANQNQDIDYDTAGVIAEELGFNVAREQEQDIDLEKEAQVSEALAEAMEEATHMERRAPVVVVMGHVDHGKTSLLDTIRQTDITSTESGGITQHIGAYQTIWKDPKSGEERAITFIDTPGHEAFTVMRSRGAKVADIAIIVVAADDGVKPQTKEVIQIVKAAKLPFVVAINKIDKENADVQRTMTDLSNEGLIPEAWGGNVPMVEISAKQKLHIDSLLDVLLLVADMHDSTIQADRTMPAVGTIIESHVNKNIGPVATVLIQAGTLRKNDKLIVNKEIYGKVRAMKDYRGEEIIEAIPSVPAQIIGFKLPPEVGDVLDLRNAENAVMIDVKQKKNEQTGAEKHSIMKAGTEENEDKKKTLNIVLRADVLGSLEALIGSLDKIDHAEVGVKIIGRGLGNFTEDDVQKAQAGHGVLVGFNVKPSSTVDEAIREKEVAFHRFTIIYDLLNWIQEELEKLLDHEVIVTELGQLEVKAIFRTEKASMIVGGLVKEGKLKKGAKLRVMRDGEMIGEGTLEKCQVGQQESKEVAAGTECGITFSGKTRIMNGDIIEAYSEEKRIKLFTLDKKE